MKTTTTTLTYKCFNPMIDPEGIIIFKGDILEMIDSSNEEILMEVTNGYNAGMQFELRPYEAARHFENISQ